MEDREALDAAQKTEQGKGTCLLIWIINPTDIKNNFRVIDVDLFLIYTYFVEVQLFQMHSKVIQLYKHTYIIFEIIFHHR